MIDNLIRRACVSNNVLFNSPEPYQIDDRLRIDRNGIRVEVCSRTARDVVGVIRQKIFRTLEDNGIPNGVSEVDPHITSKGGGWGVNQNAFSEGVEQGGSFLGLRLVFTFPLTAEAEGWFEDEGGEIVRDLRITS